MNLQDRFEDCRQGYRIFVKCGYAKESITEGYRIHANKIGEVLYAMENGVEHPLSRDEETMWKIGKWYIAP